MYKIDGDSYYSIPELIEKGYSKASLYYYLRVKGLYCIRINGKIHISIEALDEHKKAHKPGRPKTK